MSNPTRRRRLLLVGAAAALVVLVPTAYSQAAADTPTTGLPTDSTSTGATSGPEHAGHGALQAAVEPAEPGGGAPDDRGPDDRGPDDRGPDDGRGQAEQGQERAEQGQERAEQGGGDDRAEDAAAPGLEVLARDCSTSTLEPHDGFQVAPRCVDTAFGEVAAEDRSPSLLITDAPEQVAAGESFDLTVSTRNLVRDRFLGAADGGYYLESSLLTEEGIQRGHFHTACRMLESTDVAPDAAPAPAFFLATQDNQGGAEADTVTVTVTGLTPGTAQCAVWAGDGSHRVPMMQRANQTPAFDAVRITVQ